uniref:Uncharacterized protein n=1 Tax=Anguilla anguilla TaxID=7936 RepID=A0A0E9UDM6_ANGAN
MVVIHVYTECCYCYSRSLRGVFSFPD